jgi:AraC-like DNA-binding protein
MAIAASRPSSLHLALETFAALIEAIEALGRCRIVWKGRQGTVDALAGRYRRLSVHDSAFCTRVKKNRARLPRCITDDVELVLRRCDGKTRPYVKTCHAGICELVVPIMRGTTFAGALFCGAWRPKRSSCPYADCRRAYEALPVAPIPALKHLQVLLENLAVWSVEHVAGSSIPTASDPRIQSVLDLLSSEPLRAYSIPDLAREVFLSPSRLQHLFASQVGTPLNRFLTRIRLERAQQLIVCTTMPLYLVARETGYENYSYFSTLVRRSTGLSPQQLRAQSRQAASP